jgi:hypothetical protein
METLQPFKHSGEFDVAGPLLAVTAVGVTSLPLAYLYALFAYLVPFVFLDVFAAAGYGFLAGLVGALCLQYGKVRNVPIAALAGFFAGLFALYWAWSAHLRVNTHQGSLYSDLGQLHAYMIQLYEHGSWSLNGLAIQGAPLVVLWILEALLILGLAAGVAAVMVDFTPYCERTGCWLGEEKKFDHLAVFEDPADLEALRKGNFGPLRRARLRPLGAESFTRVTLKYASQPGAMRTICVDQISPGTDNNGNAVETVVPLMPVSVLPPGLFDFVSGFERFQPKTASAKGLPEGVVCHHA